jgi:hypothetical protein
LSELIGIIFFFYRSGIYFTSSAFYAIPYMTRALEPSMIVSWIIPGNTYPVIESPAIGIAVLDASCSHFAGSDTAGFSYLASPLKKGFESHYVVTALDGLPMKKIDQTNALAIGSEDGERSQKYYDEIVVTQENQILPAFILQFDSTDFRQLFSAYKSELLASKASVSSESNEDGLKYAPRLRVELDDDEGQQASVDTQERELSRIGDVLSPLLRSRDRVRINEI